MTNAHSAKAWFVAQGGTDVARHFAALTTNVAAANAFGITTTFGFWDWVGGRYSVWSAIGLPLAIAIGAQGFRDFLAGAHAMDEHFRLPSWRVICRCGWVCWTSGTAIFTALAAAVWHPTTVPSSGTRPTLQQLEMESNGKGVDLDGVALPFASAPVVWGEPGTNGQHAYFQMLHQGTDVVPVEFVAVKNPRHDLPGSPHIAVGQCAGAGTGTDAGQGRCRWA
jgi:glucose-6-phosphate isomerase